MAAKVALVVLTSSSKGINGGPPSFQRSVKRENCFLWPLSCRVLKILLDRLKPDLKP